MWLPMPERPNDETYKQTNIKIMNRDNEKKVTPDIDEAKMMELMVDGVRKDGFKVRAEEPIQQPEKEKPVSRERSRIKINSQADYEKIFFNRNQSVFLWGIHFKVKQYLKC
ncbi:hypothetical protein COR50_11805 [Chitinophaga caeni]|uniref:Uncharacterized protein n=2 Tax=Chitinophaga caeni TaxID=2029983 RepID=A0A291QV32_9BACT|nr:hypothetical protein COR50_11805 [Chitinophaga caeni]